MRPIKERWTTSGINKRGSKDEGRARTVYLQDFIRPLNSHYNHRSRYFLPRDHNLRPNLAPSQPYIYIYISVSTTAPTILGIALIELSPARLHFCRLSATITRITRKDFRYLSRSITRATNRVSLKIDGDQSGRGNFFVAGRFNNGHQVNAFQAQMDYCKLEKYTFCANQLKRHSNFL